VDVLANESFQPRKQPIFSFWVNIFAKMKN
jgi:hypothetical protein